ncbi:MAG: response regulator [Cyanobacteria bacterium]|nr:response regulator [Cyanobacteriota bacterium]
MAADTDRSRGKILIVDDESALRLILTTRLALAGYEVVAAADGEEALEAYQRESPDLIVLDVMMPKLDGYGVCKAVRQDSDVPIIMLTALGDVGDRITGLQMGADDYLSKPFSPKELEARIACVLRRVRDRLPSSTPEADRIQIGSLQIDMRKRQVYRQDRRIRLTHTEFSLLELLFNRRGEAVARAEILQTLWGYAPRVQSDMRVVDVHVARLRSKLEDDPRNPEIILTVRGTGYAAPRLALEPSEAIGA